MFSRKLFSSSKNRRSSDARAETTLPERPSISKDRSKSLGSETTVAEEDTSEHFTRSSSSKCDRAEPESIPLGLSVLHEPHGEHKADIIFIHGLGGSSYMTWCKNHAPELFWPKEWLPRDDEMHSARIFSYGYNSKLKSPKQSPTFGISEFARDLLYDLVFGNGIDGQDLRLGEVPIIFVVHSMGGLVFKKVLFKRFISYGSIITYARYKAYLEARLDTRYHHVARLTKAVVFLSTPHRGSDLVVYLRRLLSISAPSSTKQYVAELEENGFLLKELNDQFRHVAPSLQIFSFFEALKTSRAGFSAVIVDDDSAKLGYPGEICRSLNTDHQGMSKFSSPQDPNYMAVLGALKSLVSSCEENGAAADGYVLDKIREFFNMPENIEHDIEHFESRRAEGTCTGIVQQEPVKAWLEGDKAKVLWIYGRPARGKSVIASYLSRHLQSEGILTQFFFFRAGDDSKRTISSFLSSMAFQTCLNIPQFRQATSEIVKSGWKVRETEWRTLWKRMFENMLLGLNITRPIYWVVDGIDECSSPLPLLELISAINQSKIPIHIALISRWGEDISSALDRARTKAPYLSLCIDRDDEDIRLFIDDELQYTNWGDEVRANVKEEILNNANDNFLWVSLVLEEMKDCHTEEDIKERLIELPHGMSSLYQRMERAILALKRPSDKNLSQRLFSWVVQARNALATAELTDILEPDFGRILDLSHTLGRLCGQFITVEGDKSVSLVHHTAREYLTHESSLASTFNNSQTHADLFRQSLSAFLQRNISTKLASSSPSVFKYRATAWPYHLSASKRCGQVDEQLDLLCTFFSKQSVLTWINIVASLKHLRTLVDASQSLDAFVKAKRKADAAKDPTSRRYDDLEKLEGWSKDLLKIIGKFGSNLLQDPGTVYHCLAPFCPTSSQIFKSFGEQNSTGIQVRGQTAAWDDCLARVSLGSGSVGTLIACSDAHIAIVDSSGRITIWDATAFELVAVSSHGEMISAICFSSKGDSLATYGGMTTKIWNTRLGSLEVTFPNLDGTCAICMHFMENDNVLMIVSNQQYVCRAAIFEHPIGWDAASVGDVRDGEEFEGAFETAPTTLTLSPDGQKVASTFRAYPVTISSTTSFKTLQRVTRASRLVSGLKAAPFASDVAWHPDGEELLGVFKDGFSFRLNTIDGAYQELPPTPNQHPVGIHCSPDGAVYAILNGNGSVEVYDYQSSTMIYQLSSPGRISAFSFSCDGRRFYDVRRSHCTVWEPNALVRLSTLEDEPAHSHSFDDSAPKSSVASEGQDDLSAPAMLISYQNRRTLIALADAEGSVDIIDTKTLQKRNVAHISNRARAGHLAWNHDGTLLCYSELRRQISVFEVGEAKAQLAERVLTKKIAKGMTQVTFLGDSNMLLVASETGGFMFSLQPATLQASFLVDPDTPQRHWLMHPSLKQFIIAVGVDDMTVHGHEDLRLLARWQWNQHARVPVDKGRRDNISPALEEVSDVRPTFYHSYIIVKISRKTPLQDLKPRFMIFDVAGLDARGGTANMVTIPEAVFSAIELPLNILANGNFIFLDSFFWTGK
ncbi:hypothetical protein LLEC1_03471 [Akanthomyces lecanii]|uniref:NACHT domain-containing protein n=1 Tax=Cordyceps confragosa TaxID=2714763 RepID=A0A179IFG0_CORDF|nr:hypothetical protein LLEC1_03471 [Akanthomyces lecanii]